MYIIFFTTFAIINYKNIFHVFGDLVKSMWLLLLYTLWAMAN